MGELDDCSDLFQTWLDQSKDQSLKDPKIISFLKSAYENGYQKGYKKIQKESYEEWNQK